MSNRDQSTAASLPADAQAEIDEAIAFVMDGGHRGDLGRRKHVFVQCLHEKLKVRDWRGVREMCFEIEMLDARIEEGARRAE